MDILVNFLILFWNNIELFIMRVIKNLNDIFYFIE